MNREELNKLFDEHFIDDCNEVYDAQNEIVDFAEKAVKLFAIAGVSGMLLLQVKKLFAKLTDDERMEVMSDYCKYCGCDDSGCRCWNDD